MQELPVISVVTVVYNGVAHLEQAMRSVLDQQYPALEYIIIDGGSTDGSLEVIRKYEAQLAYWVSEPDGGISDAFNKGIRKATGTLVGILNADDFYEPGSLHRVAAAFCSTGAQVIHGKQQYWRLGDQGWQQDYVFSARQELLPKEMTLNHPTCFVAREVYEQHGLFLTTMRYAMDYELMLRFWQRGVRFLYLETVLANMRLAGTSDQNWARGHRESLEAKLANGIGPAKAYPYYMYMMLRTTVARLLPALGLGNVLAWFRRNFALTKKSN